MQQKYILAIDQGTSSTKALLFDEQGQAVAKGSEALHTSYLDNGFVEQDPEEIYRNVIAAVTKCLQQFTGNGGKNEEIAAIGISNQRETFVIWDKTGKPLHPAIVWQCKRSVEICGQLTKTDLAGSVKQKTGLVIDPYFSATKLTWLVQQNPSIKKAVADGQVYFGTIDTWLLFKMTGGKTYLTDYTNASRTLLFNIHTLQWDTELIDAFGLNGINLPGIKPSSFPFGSTSLNGLLSEEVPVNALIGDSHAAAFGEGCFDSGDAKVTLGTGCSILMNIGNKPVPSNNGMVTTICWSTEGVVNYALEGVIVSCGATIEWLKKDLQLFEQSKETEAMANAVANNGGVYLIPAFSGLGSPHWQMDGKAIISGLSFDTTKNHIVRAALESIGYQVNDVVKAMEEDLKFPLKELMVNGGMTANAFVMQFIADLLGITVNSGDMPDVSALGAAYLAGLKSGVYKNIDALRQLRVQNKSYSPRSDSPTASLGYKGWQQEIRNYKMRN